MDHCTNSTDVISRTLENKTIAATVTVVVAFLSKNPVSIADLPSLIKSVHDALTSGSSHPGTARGTRKSVSAVPIKDSVTPDYIICLEDGRRLKTLKRYLKRAFGLTPEAYRAKWNLPASYPMVAPNYTALRSYWAKAAKLGQIRPAAPIDRGEG